MTPEETPKTLKEHRRVGRNRPVSHGTKSRWRDRPALLEKASEAEMLEEEKTDEELCGNNWFRRHRTSGLSG